MRYLNPTARIAPTATTTLLLLLTSLSYAHHHHGPRAASHAHRHHPRAAEGLSTNPADIANKEFDYIVVGSGAGGLPVAARLTEDPTITVALIEAGGDGQNVMDRIMTPAMTYFNGMVSQGSEYDWGYMVNSRADVWTRLPRGKIFGGSTAINAMYNMRASKVEHDAWASLNPDATEDWSWDGLFPYMKKPEHFHNPSAENATFSHITVTPEFHATDGPIHVSFPHFQYEQLQYWVPTLGNLGISTRDAQGGEGYGAYITPSAIDPTTATRSYAKTGYWDPNASRSNFHVLVKHQVTKVLFDTSSSTPRATGVQFAPADAPADGSARQTYTVTAKKEVILCGGAVGSPHILLLSGVGPRAQLESLNIPVVVDLPGVGAGLRDHVQVRAAYQTSAEVTGEIIIQSEEVKNQQLALYQSGAWGSSLYSAPNNAVAYLSLKEVLAIAQEYDTGERPADGGVALAAAYVQDLRGNLASYLDQYPNLDATVRAGYELTFKTELERIVNSNAGVIELMLNNVGTFNAENKTIAIQVGLQHPFSRGSLVINSTDPFAPPVMSYNYFNHEADITMLRAGFKFVRRLAATEPFTNIILNEFQPGPDVTSDEQIDAYMLQAGNTQYHPASTASQLPRDKGGVVDSELKVYGVDSLRVIDASIMPIEISAHLMWPTYAIGEKGAAILVAGSNSKVGGSSAATKATGTKTGSTSSPTNTQSAGTVLRLESGSIALGVFAAFAFFLLW